MRFSRPGNVVMKEQEVEVSFCDLCGTSVPASDIAAMRAVKQHGKTVGQCCLVALRAVDAGSSGAPASLHAGGAIESKASQGDAGRLMTVAIVLLAALAGAVMFLDSGLARLEDLTGKVADDAATRQKGDSETLMKLSVDAGSWALQKDLDAAKKDLSAMSQSLEDVRADAREWRAAAGKQSDGMHAQLQAVAAKQIDYRPLLEDLRQRQARVMTAIDGLRSQVAAVPAAASVATREEPVVSDAAEGLAALPEKLAEEARKLADADAAVRFEAVDILIESKDEKVLPFLVPLAKDPDAFVRRLTVEGLREFKKPDAVDALISALRDDDENVCDTAWRSLCEVTGQKFRFEASASKEARARAAQAWQVWWDKARSTFGS
jgi:hypothetical protein